MQEIAIPSSMNKKFSGGAWPWTPRSFGVAISLTARIMENSEDKKYNKINNDHRNMEH